MMGYSVVVTWVLFGLLTAAVADNPLVRHIYTADPAPLVYNDTFFIFTGHDEGGSGWTLNGWHVLSSTDMVNWTDHGEVLGVADVTWLNTKQAWAAQCVERNGKFYFYICDSGEIGVAVADHVLGPYKDALGKPLVSNRTPGACPGDDNIDPTVFVDDDGKAYIYWGTDRVVRQAKLKDSMTEIDGEITVPKGLNRFFEASWVHKKDNLYYYSYAAYNGSGDNWPSNIDYATSENPLGPWTYRGTLNGAAGTGTNHPGIMQFKDNWYFVYHTDYLSGGTPWERSVQINYLYYNSDGTMKEIVQDTEGVESIGPPLFPEDAVYQIKVRHSGKLLGVQGASTDDNANVEQQSADDGEHQRWSMVEVERGVYEIVNKKSGLALDADMKSDNVLQYEYQGNSNQKWKITGNGDGAFYVVCKANNRLLEVYYAEEDDGANVQHWPFNGETCQMWEFVRVDSNAVAVELSRDGMMHRALRTHVSAGIYLGGKQSEYFPGMAVFDLKGRLTSTVGKAACRRGCFIVTPVDGLKK